MRVEFLAAGGAALALLAAQDCAQWTDTFRRALAQVREGDAEARAVLSVSAEALCAECSRCDARDVATYYLALEGDARERGLAAEARFGDRPRSRPTST